MLQGRTSKDISSSVEEDIRLGRLLPGQLLPSIRAMSQELGVSPATVAASYTSLKSRGLVLSEYRRGFRVTSRPLLGAAQVTPVPANAIDLSSGNPDPELLPDFGPALRSIDTRQRLYGDTPALAELREEFLEQLYPEADDPPSAAIVAGGLDAIERVLQTRLRPGDRIAIEDPSYTGLLDLCSALELVRIPVRIDEEGPLPESMRNAFESGASAAVITLRGQNPTGAAISAARADELRSVFARFPAVFIVESDHVGAIGLDRHSAIGDRKHWALVHSVSKSLGPDLRVGIVAGDAETIARLEGRQSVGYGWVSHINQQIVMYLLRDPDVQTRMNEVRVIYQQRREAMQVALAHHHIHAMGRSGFNLWIPVARESTVTASLLAAGWSVRPGEAYRIDSPPAIRVTTSRLQEGQAEQFAQALASILQGRSAVRMG